MDGSFYSIVTWHLLCLNGQDLPWKGLRMIRIGASTANFYPELTEKALDHVLSCGFRTLEVFVNTESELSPRFTHMLRQRPMQPGHGLCPCTPIPLDTSRFCSIPPMPGDLRTARRCIPVFFEAAAELGASIVVMHGDRQDSVLPMEESISRFEELYDCGVRYGVRLAQENVVRFRSSDNAYLRAMRDRLGEKAHFVLDLKQAVRCGHTLDDVIGAMGEHIAHVHVSDHDAERDCLPPGRGETDFQRLISRLREQRFHGTMVVELYRGNFEKRRIL